MLAPPIVPQRGLRHAPWTPHEGPCRRALCPKQSTSLAFTFWRENPLENTRLKGHRRPAGGTDAEHPKQGRITQ